MSEWIIAKLKPFDEVRKNASKWIDVHNDQLFRVYKSDKSDRRVYLNVYYDSIGNFGEEVEIRMWNSNHELYEDKYREVGTRSQKYYKEWFEWIGEEPPIIEILPESLWDISDW